MDGVTNAWDQVAFMRQWFGKDLKYQLLAGNALCHSCDSKAEVNRMTHCAGSGPGFGVDY